MPPLIEVERVTKRFGDVVALDEASFRVGEGEILGLLGPNGSGKTTTLRLVNGVIRADAGAIRVAGLDPETDGDAIRATCGTLTETARFYEDRSGIENLRFFARLHGVLDRERPEALLRDFGLADARDRNVGAYSTGMKKRLGLAKALLHRPRVLFLDEPTSGLDPEGIRLVLDHIREANRREGITVVVCSHVLPQVESVCARYAFLRKGRVVEQGTLAELEARHAGVTTLRVETDLAVADGAWRGVPARAPAPGVVEFRLASRDDVPALLRDLTREARVWSARVEDRDLESLYFRVLEAKR